MVGRMPKFTMSVGKHVAMASCRFGGSNILKIYFSAKYLANKTWKK